MHGILRLFPFACLAATLLAVTALAQDDCDWTATLQIAAPIPVLADPVDVAVAGGHGLLLTTTNLRIHDLSNLADPVLRSSLALGGTGGAVTAGAELAAVGVDDRVLLVSLQDPTAPTVLAELELPATVTALDLCGDRLAVGCGMAGIRLFDVATPEAPVPGGSLSVGIGAEVLDLSSQGELLLAAVYDRVAVIDVADLAAPVEVAAWNAPVQHPETPFFCGRCTSGVELPWSASRGSSSASISRASRSTPASISS